MDNPGRGQQAFEDGLTQFRSIAKAAAVAMKAGSLETRIRIGLQFFARYFNQVSDQRIEISEDDKYWYWKIIRCPMCWGWKADKPVCYMAPGTLQGAFDWVGAGRQFRMVETECIARGDEHCLISISKKPIE